MYKKIIIYLIVLIFSHLNNDVFAQYSVILKINPIFKSFCTSTEIKIASYEQYFSSKNVTLKQLFPSAYLPTDKKALFASEVVDISTIYEFEIYDSMEAQKAVKQLASLPQTSYCHIKHFPKLLYTPNDPDIGYQYYLTNIKAYEAWNIYKGDSTIVIGIVDVGTELTHDDLWQNIAYNYADPMDGIDNDGDGYVDNFRGWDLGNNDNSPEWSENAMGADPHGVMVSGFAACRTDNNIGIASPAFSAKFLPVKINDSTGILTRAYEGIVYAADHGCKIINCSWGGTIPDKFGEDIVRYATYNRGCLVVAAAGNEGHTTNRIYYPAGYDEVMCIAATNQLDNKWVKSCYGPHISVCAPGENVFSTYEYNGYTSGWGTSFASPIVASEAALVWGYKGKQLSSFQVRAIIENTCDPIDTVSGNEAFAHQLGKGRINCYRALTDTLHEAVRFIDYTFANNNDTTYLTGTFINLFHATSHLVAKLVTDNPNVIIENPEITMGELDSLQSYNNTSQPFKILYSPSSPYDLDVSFYLEYYDTTKFDQQYLKSTLNLSYVDISNNDLLLTVCANGKLGYNSFNPVQGKGLLFRSDVSLLSEMGLIVSDGNNYSYSFRGGDDFKIEKGAKKTEDAASVYANSMFNDSLSNFPIGVNVHFNASLSKLPATSDFILLNYTVTNHSDNPLDSLYTGLFSDIDLLNPARNKIDYDSLMKMIYAFPANMNDVHVGFLLPNKLSHHIYAIDNDGANGSIRADDGFISSELQFGLTTNRFQAGGSIGNDISLLVNYGPVYLAVSDSVTLNFILLTGRNKFELFQSAMNAMVYYDSIIGIKPNELFPVIQLFPNPAHDYFMIQVNDNTLKIAQLDVVDLIGNIIYSRNYINSDKIMVPVVFSSGLYIVHVKGDNHKDYFSKIIIK
jgi:hypothetical protein